jgi:superfamily II DNA or RNA helicase
MLEQRQYQADDVNYAMNHGTRDRVIHCAPTGSGKTVIQVLVAAREMARGNSTAILTPRNEIFSQTFELAATEVGLRNVTALRAKRDGETWNPIAPIHVVSWPTLVKRAKDSNWWFPKVDRVLVDECHLSMAPKILEILQHYEPKAIIDGYSATPERPTGKGLGRFWTEIKHVTTVRQLVKDGYLARCEYWGGATPDLHGIRIVRGDYAKKELSRACVKLVGDAIDNWLRLASDRQTIVFAVDIAHCEMLAHKFIQVGVKAASLHVRLPQEQRDRIVRAFKAGEIQVLVNVSIASYGFDSKEVSCVQICRPTRSIVLHLQMIGRGMRPKDDGGECLVLDHAGNVRALGFADDLFRWRLDEGKTGSANWTRDPKSGEAEEAKAVECEECHHLFQRSRVCPMCGWEKPFAKRDVDVIDGDLVPIGKALHKRLPEDFPTHDIFYAMLRHYAQEKGYNQKWAAAQYRQKCDAWPPFHWNDMAMVPPAPRVRNWILGMQIRYAKGKAKGRARA